MERDKSNRLSLVHEGWRVLTIWECALRGKRKLELNKVLELASEWLLSTGSVSEIKGDIAFASATAIH